MSETAVGETFSIRRIIRFETKRIRMRSKDYIVVLTVGGRDVEVRCTTPRLLHFGWFRTMVRRQHRIEIRDVGQHEWRRILNDTKDRLGIHFGSIESPEAPWERPRPERRAP